MLFIAAPTTAGTFSVTYGIHPVSFASDVLPTKLSFASGTLTISGLATRATPSSPNGNLSVTSVFLSASGGVPTLSGWNSPLSWSPIGGNFSGATPSGGDVSIAFWSINPGLRQSGKAIGVLTLPSFVAPVGYGFFGSNNPAIVPISHTYGSIFFGHARFCAELKGSLAPATCAVIRAASNPSGFDILGQEINRSITLSHVPEPYTALLLATGALAVLLYNRRASRQVATEPPR